MNKLIGAHIPGVFQQPVRVKLDILHNNAGGPFAGAVESADDETLQRVISVNLIGVFKMTQEALPA